MREILAELNFPCPLLLKFSFQALSNANGNILNILNQNEAHKSCVRKVH